MALTAPVFIISFRRDRIKTVGQDAQEVTELFRRAVTRIVGDRGLFGDEEVAEAGVGMVGTI